MCVDPLKSFRILLLELVDFTVLKKWGERERDNKQTIEWRKTKHKQTSIIVHNKEQKTKKRRKVCLHEYVCTMEDDLFWFRQYGCVRSDRDGSPLRPLQLGSSRRSLLIMYYDLLLFETT
jgi:hypothetical protein